MDSQWRRRARFTAASSPPDSARPPPAVLGSDVGPRRHPSGGWRTAAMALSLGLAAQAQAQPAAPEPPATVAPVADREPLILSDAERAWGSGTGPTAGGPPRPLYPSGDPWSMQDRRLAHSRIIDQLKAPSQQHRLLAGGDRFVVAADNTVATAVTREGDAVSQWHGYFATDLNAAVRVIDGLDVNFNTVFWQLSASNGYRSTTGVRPGLSVHWSGEVFELGGAPVRADLQALDLGEVTIGRGLMFEREWFEGYLARATWRDLSLEVFTAGQTYILNDDLFAITLRLGEVQSGLPGLALTAMQWQQGNGAYTPRYLSLSGDLPGLGPKLRVGAEGVLRFGDAQAEASGAAMVRADWRYARYASSPFQLHLGYQFRYYHDGFAPNADDIESSSSFLPLPWNDDTYDTHPTQFVGLSAWYRQWAHTLMFESKMAITRRWGLQAEVEGRAWFFDDPRDPARVYARPGFGSGNQSAPLLPDPQFDVYYRFWVTLHPFTAKPYRLRAGIANIFANYGQPHTDARLIEIGPFAVFDMEVPL